MILIKNKETKNRSNSKFISQVFDGWLVVDCENVNKNHKRFFSTKNVNSYEEPRKLMIMVRDNELTKLSHGLRGIHSLLAGKIHELDHQNNIFQNATYNL